MAVIVSMKTYGGRRERAAPTHIRTLSQNLAIGQRLMKVIYTSAGDFKMPITSNTLSRVNSFRCSNRSSSNDVLLSESRLSCLNPLRCSDPASLTKVPSRSTN